MRVAIMQPYFFPYLGYYQLIQSCDVFVLYDDVKYTKKGWISRNRIQQNGRVVNVSLQLKNDRDDCLIGERSLALDFDRAKLFRKVAGAYSGAAFWDESKSVLNAIIGNKEENLFGYLNNSIEKLLEFLEIPKTILISSQLIDKSLSGTDRVIAICKELGADEYINPIGGVDLYSPNIFKDNGLGLGFISSKLSPYSQSDVEFIPGLSIIDLMVNVGIEELRHRIKSDFEIERF